MIRLDKYLADSGFGTRNEVRSLVKSGSVFVNNEIVKDFGIKIDPDKDEVSVKGKSVEYNEYEYYMLHKPAGIITASRDKNAKTVVDLIETRKRRDLFPIGRLDKDTEGLLVITNDGALSHRFLSPNSHVQKTYVAFVSGELPSDVETHFKNGIDIGDEKLTLPAGLREIASVDALVEEFRDQFIVDSISDHLESLSKESFGDNDSSECLKSLDSFIKECRIYEVVLTEGRYHEIKRMFEALGGNVEYLKRYSMGPITLDSELAPGEYRKLDKEEMKNLLTSK